MAYERRRAMIAVAIAVLGLSASAFGGPARLPNKQAYRVTATATATGRTGSAMMSARALIDRDGQASLEVASGDFETPPVGSLTKLLLKTYDGDGKQLYANTVTGISTPSLVMPLASVGRGQALEIQGNIRDVDNARTDVVSVTTVGRLRPDLAVLHVEAPPNAAAGMPVHVTATLAELNQDTGARATCVLLVDDRVVDKAEGIWVDAGDTVSCAFSHLFTTGGVHQFRVDVSDVNPGDWDSANNTASGSIAIVTGETTFNIGTASVNSSSRHYRSHSTGFTRQAGDNLVMAWDVLNDQSDDSDGAQYHAFASQTLVTFPLTQIAVEQWSDDTLIHAGAYHSVAPTSVGLFLTCALVVDDTADQAVHVEVCTYNPGSGANPLTSVTYGRFAGTVTYFASQYQAAWYETPDGVVPVYEYSFNHREAYSAGTPSGLGSAYRFEVRLISGETAYSKSVTVPIGPWQTFSDINYPWLCRENSDPWYGYKKTCEEYINFSKGRGGTVSWP